MKFNKDKINNTHHEMRVNFVTQLMRNEIKDWDLSFLEKTKITREEVERVASLIIYGSPLPILTFNGAWIEKDFKLQCSNEASEKLVYALLYLYSHDEKYSDLGIFDIEITDSTSFTFKSMTENKSSIRTERLIYSSGVPQSDLDFFDQVAHNISNTKIHMELLTCAKGIETYNLTHKV